jgi:hypothetical protein
LLAEFYAATQDKKEDVAAWSCRLEDLLDKAEEASPQQSRSAKERESMLRSRFWMGLQQQLKDSSRHKYDTIQDYDKLRVEIRQIEHEYMVREKQGKDSKGSSQAQAKMSTAAATPPDDEEATEQDSFKTLEAMVKKLSHQVSNMHNEMQNFRKKTSKEEKPGASTQETGDQGSSQSKGGNTKAGTFQGKGGGGQTRNFGNTRGEPFACYKCGGKGHMKRDCPSKNINVPTCWNCNEEGHTKYTCPHNSNLNLEKPLSGSGQ